MAHFILDIETNSTEKTAALRLSDQAGIHLGSNNVRLADHPPSKWEGVFNAHEYVNRYEGNLRIEGREESLAAEEIVAEIGAFLGKVVLGPEIMGRLSNRMRHLIPSLTHPAASSPPSPRRICLPRLRLFPLIRA